jgi:hypothetical protein
VKCRHCGALLTNNFIDLGLAPPSNNYLSTINSFKSEIFYPLKIMVCNSCWLVQTNDYASAESFFTSEYAYFSSTSTTWLSHAKLYSEMISEKIGLTKDSFVIEVASNDGYLLKNFVRLGIPCLGIEPTDSTAIVAENLGIPVFREFFGEALGKKICEISKQADLIIGNNVYAHVPNINDFTRGLKSALKTNGTITLEFPHIMRLIDQNQFDTIYHEHFSYLSLYTVSLIFKRSGLRVFDVDELSTHGGSLRIYGCHEHDVRKTNQKVVDLIKLEDEKGLQKIETYCSFQAKAEKIKNDFRDFLIKQKKLSKKVVAYGAAAKGNTLLNFAGIKSDLLSFVCDAAPSKQGRYMPGSHIPILPPEALKEYQPDFILVLPWNILEEIKNQISGVITKNTKFVIAIPELLIV